MDSFIPNKILLVQLFSNGDCLYATTIARQIKEDFPGCKLTWAIAGFCKNIISENPYVDDIIITDEVAKNDVAALRRYKKKIFAEKEAGIWDEVFVTTNMDTNLAYYDGTIRGMILRAYGKRVNVPVQPVVQLTKKEINNVTTFSKEHKLESFKHVILWEYAPQSGQSLLNFEMVMNTARRLVLLPSVCIILTSANKFEGTENIIDASTLSIRENAALTHYCNLLIGCSSGITWLTTSNAAKFLPMVQLLNPNTVFINTPSTDFKRYNIEHAGLIEMGNFTEEQIYDCVHQILTDGFSAAEKYNEEIPLQFNTTKKIVYNLLVYREFAAIGRHFKIMKSVYGLHPLFLKAFFSGLAFAPVTLLKNIIRKRVFQN